MITLEALIARIRAGAWVDATEVLPLLVETDAENARMTTALDRIGNVLADEGCSCDEDVAPESIEDDVPDEDVLCLGHRIERAWKRGTRG